MKTDPSYLALLRSKMLVASDRCVLRSIIFFVSLVVVSRTLSFPPDSLNSPHHFSPRHPTSFAPVSNLFRRRAGFPNPQPLCVPSTNVTYFVHLKHHYQDPSSCTGGRGLWQRPRSWTHHFGQLAPQNTSVLRGLSRYDRVHEWVHREGFRSTFVIVMELMLKLSMRRSGALRWYVENQIPAEACAHSCPMNPRTRT